MIKALGDLMEILRGLAITARHFFVNVFFRTLNAAGVKTRKAGTVTIQYPEQKKALASRHRSLHRVTAREDGSPRCVACLLCVTVCPAECIYVEAREVPDPEIQKVPSRFEIDLSRCCFCGFCVEACPEDAIRMDTGRIELAVPDRGQLRRRLERPGD
ncbi:MAG TPA: NADH-quinone oxidoreductase subunit I [Candidatus Aminicenantes bacterium]|nr:NADH-quinone oxidoreductase subunit I [Acidobacteriota bacterium]HOI45324.1 NADH-quinone oxidoreductase subunit I [Candidatus Aminicenantes bacterium]